MQAPTDQACVHSMSPCILLDILGATTIMQTLFCVLGRGHVDSVNHVCWQPGTNVLCTASTDKTLSLWDPRSGLCSHTFYGHSNSCSSADFSSQVMPRHSADWPRSSHIRNPWNDIQCVETLSASSFVMVGDVSFKVTSEHFPLL